MEKHIMIDIETLGTKPGCVILQIGVVTFYPSIGKIEEKLLLNCQVENQMASGKAVDIHTLLWWMKQNEAARNAINEGQKRSYYLGYCLAELAKFIEIQQPAQIWVKGLDFDIPILNHAFDTNGEIPLPWDYKKLNCLRTLMKRYPNYQYQDLQTYINHDALQDAIKQAHQCMELLKLSELSYKMYCSKLPISSNQFM